MFAQNFVKTMPHVYMESLLDSNKIPKEYGGSSTTFQHNVLQYSFNNSEMSTFDTSIANKATLFLASSFAYDVAHLDGLKKKIEFVESNIEEIVFNSSFFLFQILIKGLQHQ